MRVQGDVAWHAALEEAIEALGFAAVVPLFYEVRRNKAGKVVWQGLSQAFPGYALVEMDLRHGAWRQVPRVPGVRRLIGPAEQPTPVMDVQAAFVLAQFGPDGVQRREVDASTVAPLPVGATVRVVGGLGLGWVGTVVASDGRSVSVDVGGKMVRMAQAGVAVCAPYVARG